MELLPIIYTTLVIFAGIALVTIIGSYISYKVRVKRGLLEEFESTNILETPDIIRQRANQNSNLKKESSSSSQRPREEKNSSKSNSEKSYKRERESDRERKSERDRKDNAARERKREHEKYHEEKRLAEEKKIRDQHERIQSKERIQVLNNLDTSTPNREKKSTSEFSKPQVNPKKYNTLGDDIMKNYADSKDDSFKPLKTKNNKN